MSYFKRFLIFALSALLIVAQPVAYAASPVGWGVTPLDIVIGAAGNTVTAIKGAGASALQSTVKYAPTVGNIGKTLVKGAGGVALIFAVEQILGSVDWLLDPANNRIKYTVPGEIDNSLNDQKCRDAMALVYGAGSYNALNTVAGAPGSYYKDRCVLIDKPTHILGNIPGYKPPTVGAPQEKYLPINTVAAKVQSNAAAGHAPSQELIKTVIIDDVNAGALDVPLNTAAVPKADAPSVPDPNNPPWQPGQEVPPFDPSSIIAAIKSVMAAVVNMSGVLGAKIDALMIDLGLKQEEKLAADVANTAEIVAANDRTGAKVAEMVAAIEAIEGNTMDGQVINDAIDRVIANDNVKVGDIVAAIEAIEGNTMDGQVINDAIDRVIANDNVNAQSSADAANAAAEAAKAAKAADAANTTAVTDAIEAAESARSADALEAKEAADAKAAADADALEWAKEAPEAPTDTGVIVDEPISDFDSDKSYITFTGSCPPKYTASLSIMGATAPFEFDYTPICTVMSYLKPFIVGAGYIAAAYIIAGHSRGSKD